MIMVGADPELFLRQGRRLVSAISLIDGTKYEPLKTKHGAIQWDNILAEYNIDPASCAPEFVSNNLDVLNDLQEHLGNKIRLDFGAAYYAPQSLLLDPRTLVAGCSADFNAWKNGEKNEPPKYGKTRLRSAGGHVHISVPDIGTDPIARINLVKLCDVHIGLVGVILGDATDILRTQVYGKAGAYRPKYKHLSDPYDGVEYRSSSNWWLRTPERMQLVFNGAVAAVNSLDNIKALSKLEYHKDAIQETINTGNKEMAQSLIRGFNET